jgi:hypothetical protein
MVPFRLPNYTATIKPERLLGGGLFLAVSIRVGDIVDAAVGLSLASTVIGRLGGEAFLEQCASQLGASVLEHRVSSFQPQAKIASDLSVDVVVGYFDFKVN